jgi:hypothetical protein
VIIFGLLFLNLLILYEYFEYTCHWIHMVVISGGMKASKNVTMGTGCKRILILIRLCCKL